MARRGRAPILFFRFTPDDFRTEAARKAFDELGANYVEAIGIDKSPLFDSLRRGGRQYIFGRSIQQNKFKTVFDLSKLEAYKQALYAAAIDAMERKLSAFLAEYKIHRWILRQASFRVLYGIDDTQVILPLVYACQDAGIRTVAHQHGAAYHPWHASYVMENLNPEEIRWFDTLIVWGEHWKNRIARISRLIPAARIVVGGDLFGELFERGSERSMAHAGDSRVVLVPYEFLTSTYHVGLYVARLLDLGYDVWFKPRADEDLLRQIDAYCLPPGYQTRLRIVPRLTPELMTRVDVVAGTMSTLLYQLLVFRKPIWLLETVEGSILLQDLVDLGWAHRIRYEDLDHLGDRHFAAPDLDVSYVTSRQSLRDTLAKHVVAAAAEHRRTRASLAGVSTSQATH